MRGSIGVPNVVQKIRPVSCHADSAAGRASSASTRRGRKAATQMPGSGSVASETCVLGFPVQQLPPDALELPADNELGGVQVDVVASQPQHLAFASSQTKTRT